MRNIMSDNLLSKLTRLHVEERSFTPDGASQPIEFSVAVLSISLNGQPSTIELKSIKINHKS